MILLIVVMIAFMYFGMMRPQRKQQQKRMEMLNQMKKGDKVVTIGGLHGVIDSIDQAKGTVDLDLDGIYLTFNLTAIRTVNQDSNQSANAQPQAVAKAKPKEAADNTETGATDDAKSAADTSDDKPYSEPKSDDETK